jgi:shikimate 5-dehydrogenase
VTILNRSRKKGERLAVEIDAAFRPLTDFRGNDYGVVVNATSVGMHPHSNETPIPEDQLADGMVVMDIVYNPLRTRLLAAAENRGCRTVDGLAMFVRQGAAQFELWTGQKAPVDLMTRTVRSALEAQS